MTIYNEFLLSIFLNVSMFFLQHPANPDLLYIIFFCHSQLTITILLCLIFASKLYLVMKGQGKDEDTSNNVSNKPAATKKFVGTVQKQISINRNSNNNDSSNSTQLSEKDIKDELDKMLQTLQLLKQKNSTTGSALTTKRIQAIQEALGQDFTGQKAPSGINPSLQNPILPIQSNGQVINRQMAEPVNPTTNKPILPVKLNPTVNSNQISIEKKPAVIYSCPQKKPEIPNHKCEQENTETINISSKINNDSHNSTNLPKKSPEEIVCGRVNRTIQTDDTQEQWSLINHSCSESSDLTIHPELVDNTVQSGHTTPIVRAKQQVRSGHARTHKIIINLDDKNRFTDEVTV